MNKYLIKGGGKLNGKICIPGAKNSVLPILASAVLIDGKITLHNCPNLRDVDSMIKILKNIGCIIEKQEDTLIIDSSHVVNGEIDKDLAKELRSSIFLLGPILARLKKAKVAYPGGCEIGLRPIDLHLSGLRALNIDILESGGYIYCDSQNAKCSDITLGLPSVGATENIMMASIFTKGRTVIRNVAREPEIVDLQNFLNKAGAKIYGAGSSVIVVEGVKKLNSVEYTPIPDRIVAGSYMISVVMCGGDVEFCNVIAEHIHSLLSKFSKTTCNISVKNDIIRLQSNGRHRGLGKIDTVYYPGFPTDLQSQMLALASICDGNSIITENIFETRFKQVPEFIKMGANIQVSGRTAIVQGVKSLDGAEVTAYDLRGGASLVSMGLFAKGETLINDIYHIERGYESIDKDYNSLGANIIKLP